MREFFIELRPAVIEAALLAPVLSGAAAPASRNLRPPWPPGQSGNLKGRTSYKLVFEEALVAKLVQLALDGDPRMMVILVDRLVPKIQRHKLEAADAPTKRVIESQRSEPAAAGKGCSPAAG